MLRRQGWKPGEGLAGPKGDRPASAPALWWLPLPHPCGILPGKKFVNHRSYPVLKRKLTRRAFELVQDAVAPEPIEDQAEPGSLRPSGVRRIDDPSIPFLQLGRTPGPTPNVRSQKMRMVLAMACGLN
jgi:hypothetical protein